MRLYKERLQRLQARQTLFKQRALAQKPSICLGNRTLFLTQCHLADNGFARHEAWKRAWQRSRSSQFFVLGSKDENAGCQGCVILPQGDGLFTLRIRMPDVLKDQFGEYCHVTDVAFGHVRHWLEQAIAAIQQRKFEAAEYRQLDGDKPKETEYLAAFGQAISYRFVRDEKRGWRVLVTTERSMNGAPPPRCGSQSTHPKLKRAPALCASAVTPADTPAPCRPRLPRGPGIH